MTRELYDSINEPEHIRAFVERQEQEGLNLEFKTLGRPDWPRDDRKMLAQVVSGFANSAGGVCVWGVMAKRGLDGIDCARECVPIPNATLALSTIKPHLGAAVHPILPGVEAKAIRDVNDAGYIVLFVPESDTGPHMAKLGEDRFYKRSVDNFYKMEWFDIADMFGRRRRPVPRFFIEAQKTEYQQCRILWGVCNQGRGLLTHPYVEITPSPDYVSMGLSHASPLNLVNTLRHGPRFTAVAGTAVIHPGMNVVIGTLMADLRGGEDKTIAVEYLIRAEGIEPVAGTCTIVDPLTLPIREPIVSEPGACQVG